VGFVLTSADVRGEGDIKVFGEQVKGSIFLYAGNIAFCPASLKLELELTNMEPAEKIPEFYVVPSGTDRFLLVELRVIDPKLRFSYRNRYQYVLGDAGLSRFDKEYVYDLPFEKKGRYMVFQGYNGAASHQNQFALDFSMSDGTPVLAAREGVVVNVQQSNSISCPQPECGKYNNFVLVYHPDGTFAEYTHLQKDGARVQRGDKVEKGTLIGLSGNTGWTSGPHLHFVCFMQRLGSRESFPTEFRTGDGSKVEALEEKSWYDRNY
jgi:hypothetical protein